MSGNHPTGGRRAPGSRRPRALVMAGLLAFAGLATTFEVHPHREVLGGDLPRHALQGETVLLGASHPASAPHVEGAADETTLRCPVCLLHFQSAGEAAAESVAAVSPTPPGRLAAPAASLPRAAARLPGGSRAPPTSR